MLMLINEPANGQQKEAFNILDQVFGTSEFSEGQAVNSIAVGLEISEADATQVLSTLKRNDAVGEV